MEDGWKTRKVWTVEIFTASFPVVFVWIAVMDSFHLNHWWTCFRQVLGCLFTFTGELLFFCFYCEQVWGWCLMPLRKPGPVIPLFVVLVFCVQASVDWFGWAPLPGLSWIHWYLQCSLNCPPFHFTMHFPHTHLLSMGLNVVKCNLGEAKHHTISPLKVSVWWCLKGAIHRVVVVTF